MRKTLTTSAELAGMGLVALGLGLVAWPLGLIGLGVGLFAVGYMEAE